MRRHLTIALLLAATALAGCGGDDQTTGTDDTGTTEAQAVGAASVSIEMTEYSYAVSGPLAAGESSEIEVSNAGKEFHMAALGRLKPGKTVSDVSKALQQGGPPAGDQTTTTTAAGAPAPPEEDPLGELFVKPMGDGVTLLSPGSSEKLVLPIFSEPGDFALICFLATEGEGTPHFAKGMVGALTVTEGGDAATAPAPTAEYVIEDGKVAGPATLEAGKNILRIETKGGDHEAILASMKAGKRFKDLDDYITKIFESGEGGGPPPPKGAAAQSPGSILASVVGFPSGTTSFIEVDLEPGTYVLACVKVDNEDDEDKANDVKHYVKEQLTIKVA